MIIKPVNNQSMYDAVAETVANLANYTLRSYVLQNYIVKLHTCFGTENVILTFEGLEAIFDVDWYEGGEVELLGFIALEDVDVPDLKF